MSRHIDCKGGFNDSTGRIIKPPLPGGGLMISPNKNFEGGLKITSGGYKTVQQNKVTDHQPLTWPSMTNVVAICKSYKGHIWAIQKLYISHKQPTVQATDVP